MLPFIFGGIVVGVGYLIYEGLFASDKVKITEVSNCHEKFLEFNKKLSLDDQQIKNLRSAHRTIREKLKSYFLRYPNMPVVNYYIQGSYKMGTIVENLHHVNDVDLGIYFQSKPNVSINTIQNHIKKALTGHTSRNVEVKEMCVRIHYVRDFHIDLPLYYEENGIIYFGSKKYGWQKSDPKDFINWFKVQTKDEPQLIRIIRYLKAWADYRKFKTNKKFPSGLVLTLWAIQHYVKDVRDDIAFILTCDNILKYLNDHFTADWKAKIPVAPYDNTLNRLNTKQKENFYEEFEALVEDGIDAISVTENEDALYAWENIFGNRFNNH